MRWRWLVIALSAIPVGLNGEAVRSQPAASAASRAPACAIDPMKLRGICNDVYSRTPDATNPGIWTYRYEKKIYDAACVNFATDSPASARLKIQTLWNGHEVAFQCDALNFPVQRGNILKYAAQMENYNVLDNAIKYWRLDLNIIDHSDNATLLDFIERRYVMHKDTETSRTLENYWALLRRSGAKRCREIEPHRKCSRTDHPMIEELARRFPASPS